MSKKNVIASNDEWQGEVAAMFEPELRREDGWATIADIVEMSGGRARSTVTDYLNQGAREGRYEKKQGIMRQADGRLTRRTAYRRLRGK